MSRQTRVSLVALGVVFSAGVHAALVPEHLDEMPPLGVAFIVAAVLGAAIAIALAARPHDARLLTAAAVFCLGQIGAWVLFVTVPVPFFDGTPEPVETIALVCKAIEACAFFVALDTLVPVRTALARRNVTTAGVAALGGPSSPPRSRRRAARSTVATRRTGS